MKFQFSPPISEKYWNITFHENVTMGAELIHSEWRNDGQTGRRADGQTDMAKLIVALRNFDMIYLTAIGLPPGGSSTVHIYTQTVRRTTKSKQYMEQQKKI
jgi:hypothetical protein